MQKRRDRLRQEAVDEIKTHARAQMDKEGAASLTLRTIATEMGISPPALHRYFANRDELLTALIVDAYQGLGNRLEQELKADSTDDPAMRLYRLAMVYRQWAIKNQGDFTLIFGTPVPGYHAPEEITLPVARQAIAPLMETLDQAFKYHLPNEELPIPEEAGMSLKFSRELQGWAKTHGANISMPAAHATLSCWSRLEGLMMLELFGHLRFITDNPAEFFRLELQSIFRSLCLPFPKD